MNIQPSIQQANSAASTGDTKTAMAILRDVIKQNPRNVDAWLALAGIVENPEQAKQCLVRVLQIDPDNQIAQQKLHREQPNDLDLLFERVDEPVLEPEDNPEPESALDFSKLYMGENQASQSGFGQEQPYKTVILQSQAQDQSTPPSGTPAPPQMQRRQKPPPGRIPSKKKPKKKGLSIIEIILIALIGFMCICVACLGIFYFGDNTGILEETPTDLPDEVTAVIYENIRASNGKDMDRYMATIHSKSPVYTITKEGVEEAFTDEFILSYRVSDVYIIEQGRDKAVVHFVLTTKLVSGPISFRDNQVTGEMELRKADGVWKIYNQEVIDVKYLD